MSLAECTVKASHLIVCSQVWNTPLPLKMKCELLIRITQTYRVIHIDRHWRMKLQVIKQDYQTWVLPEVRVSESEAKSAQRNNYLYITKAQFRMSFLQQMIIMPTLDAEYHKQSTNPWKDLPQNPRHYSWADIRQHKVFKWRVLHLGGKMIKMVVKPGCKDWSDIQTQRATFEDTVLPVASEEVQTSSEALHRNVSASVCSSEDCRELVDNGRLSKVTVGPAMIFLLWRTCPEANLTPLQPMVFCIHQ